MLYLIHRILTEKKKKINEGEENNTNNYADYCTFHWKEPGIMAKVELYPNVKKCEL